MTWLVALIAAASTAAPVCSARPLLGEDLRACLEAPGTQNAALSTAAAQLHDPKTREEMVWQLPHLLITDTPSLQHPLTLLLQREGVLAAGASREALPSRTMLARALTRTDARVQPDDCAIESEAGQGGHITALLAVVCRHRFCKSGCQVMEAVLRFDIASGGLKLREAREVSRGDTGECGCCTEAL